MDVQQTKHMGTRFARLRLLARSAEVAARDLGETDAAEAHRLFAAGQDAAQRVENIAKLGHTHADVPMWAADVLAAWSQLAAKVLPVDLGVSVELSEQLAYLRNEAFPPPPEPVAEPVQSKTTFQMVYRSRGQ